MFLPDLSRLAETLAGGEAPKSRETVADCLGGCLIELLRVYAKAEGRLALEIGFLLEALRNPDDPAVKAMSLTERGQMRLALTMIDQVKEAVRAQKEN